jgi:hypothetical protein
VVFPDFLGTQTGDNTFFFFFFWVSIIFRLDFLIFVLIWVVL